MTLTPYSGFTSSTVNAIKNSAYQWNIAAGKTLVSIGSPAHNVSSGDFKSKGGKNYIWKLCIDEEFAGYTYATNSDFWTGAYKEVDICINTKYNWANSAQPNCYDTHTIFLHEAGHVVGLDDLHHDKDFHAVMYYHAFTNKTKRELTRDDRDGAKYIVTKYSK